jgi:tRNA(Ile)-lysidine synthase
MTSEGNEPKERIVVAAVSGGPDSVYLLHRLLLRKGVRIVVGHVNHGARGRESEKDQKLVEKIARELRLQYAIGKMEKEGSTLRRATGKKIGRQASYPPGFEEKARSVRYAFLKRLASGAGAGEIALAHIADDQVETILMRVFEGAGIAGLKGIPRETNDRITRPILDVWREDILAYLNKHNIYFRVDRSNFDTRFERNWIRHVLIPLLEKRYGKAVKKRIFTLGERFRELDDYLEAEAARWIRRNVKPSPGRMREDNGGGVVFPRGKYSVLPSVLRVKILQRICFDRLGVAPNERLLKAMDGSVSSGGPSARVNVGKGWQLANRYEEALFAPGKIGSDRKSKGEVEIPVGPKGGGIHFVWEAGKKITPAQAKRLAAKGDVEVFDAAGLALPLTVRPLRAGDRIRPFGGSAGGNGRDGEKKVKEILIDRKIPRDDRWGRPVVCDAEGAILWIPGVLRSAHAPVTPETRKTALLRIRAAK